MAKLPKSFRKKNHTTLQFRKQYARLPASIQEAVKDSCRLFDKNPHHRSLRLHLLEDRKHASHSKNSWSVSATAQHRAIYVVNEEGINLWYWIGTHADYDTYTGE
jgi:hypothetical protein